MKRDFVGTGYQNPQRFTVHVEQDGIRQSLTHYVHGTYVDYQWDGGGPASTDLAQALLWTVTGVEPEWRTYRLFKNDVIAAWPRGLGECWRVSEDEIRDWLAELERNTAQGENAVQTGRRREQTRARDQRVRSFVDTFAK
jgi:hypothetical protein